MLCTLQLYGWIFCCGWESKATLFIPSGFLLKCSILLQGLHEITDKALASSDSSNRCEDFVSLVQNWLIRIQDSSSLRGTFGETSQSELAAFTSYALAFPNSFLALVDTYDVSWSLSAILSLCFPWHAKKNLSSVNVFPLGWINIVGTIMLSCKEKKCDQPRTNYVELLIIRNRHPSSSCRSLISCNQNLHVILICFLFSTGYIMGI